MFANSLEYMETLLSGRGDTERILENRPEDYAVIPAAPGAADVREFKQGRVDSMVWAFRDIGFLYAGLNPLGEEYERDFTRLPEYREGSYHRLAPEEFGLSEEDLDTEFFGGRYIGPGPTPLREILDRLRKIYCSSVGVEFLHIQNKDIREWLIRRIEEGGNSTDFTREQKLRFLADLMGTEEMENALHKTFIGQKRFSVQGADAMIPALHYIADNASRHGIQELVIGASHRGRLSILNQILGKPPGDIFHLFEENVVPGVPGGSGDVKYHIGYCTRHVNDDGTSVSVTLLPNSSHLESVTPVAAGNARGLQDQAGDATGARIMPVILHGDASFAGQGVVAETFNLSRLPGYSTGGTIPIVVNNQIGFTTSSSRGHSGLNPTDIAKMLPVPVFHVNGDDIEAVVHVVRMAMEYRQAFHRDIVVDIVCYRRFGHNEGDEPSYTQPYMYELIKNHESAPSLYLKKCLGEGIISEQEARDMRDSIRKPLSVSFDREHGKTPGNVPYGPGATGSRDEDADTAVEETVLRGLADRLTAIPSGFTVHRRLEKIILQVRDRFMKNSTFDWSLAESLAFGSLLLEGVPVRLSGQDSERGTFSQRHMVWWEEEREECCHYAPLESLEDEHADISILNSPLSEYSVLAFEYGYSIARRNALVIWEAQFGDFVNGAQIIVDNYIVPGRSKWDVKSALVLLLPHGYEGMGPEHSDAKLERFLLLCAEDSIRVCNVTTPAQYFHLLRRQMKLRDRRPLVVMTPKSLLRHPMSVSALEDISKGGFRRVITDAAPEVRRLLFCSGKIYYDIAGAMTDEDREITGIVRLEQLYPFPEAEIREAVRNFGKVKSYFWVQEEPKNRGAWLYASGRFGEAVPEVTLNYIGREASASPATGSHSRHREEQEQVVSRALNEYTTRIGMIK